MNLPSKWQVCGLMRTIHLPFRTSWNDQVRYPGETISRSLDLPKGLSPESLYEPLSQLSLLINGSQWVDTCICWICQAVFSQASILTGVGSLCLKTKFGDYFGLQSSTEEQLHLFILWCLHVFSTTETGEEVLTAITWHAKVKVFTENRLTTQKVSTQCSKRYIVCN